MQVLTLFSDLQEPERVVNVCVNTLDTKRYMLQKYNTWTT